MRRVLLTLFALSLLVCSRTAAAQTDVVYSNFMASNGYSVDITHSWGSVDFTIAVAFTVPAGFDYCLQPGRIDFVGSSLNGPVSLLVEITEGAPTGPQVVSAAVSAVPVTPQLLSASATAGVLHSGVTYYLQLTPLGGGQFRWWGNDAGLVGELLLRDNRGFIPGFFPTPFYIPVFRILASPCSPPAVKPSYSAYATLAPTMEADAEVRMEVICPPLPGQEPAPLFTCPVQIHVAANATSAEVCEQLAAAINSHAYGCWFPPNVSFPQQPSAFHADCDGNNVRITNSQADLCPGAFVCADVVENLDQFASKFSSYEYDGVSGPLFLEFGDVVSGIAADSSFPDAVKVVGRGLITGAIFSASVPLTPGLCPCQIGRLLAEAFDNPSVTAFARGIRFQPPEPYDIAVSVNDTTLDWALSPFPNLLELSVGHPPTLVPSCTSSPTRLCLHHNRFAVEAVWTTAAGTTGTATALRTTPDSGYFTFFSIGNVEVTAKIVDACAYAQRFWFFAAGLTNVGVDITVTDTLTGQVQQYHRPIGAPFAPLQDGETFDGCP